MMKSYVSLLFAMGLLGCATPLKPEPRVTVAEQQGRALMFGAVLSAVNGEPLGVLAEAPISSRVRDGWVRTLAASWDVKSRADLLETLKWIDEGGHRKLLRELREELKNVPVEFLPERVSTGVKDQEDLNRRFIAALSLRAPERRVPDITAWDYGRYINLCRWGYYSGYLTEEEAWARIMPVGRYLQASYDSWADYAEDYLRGREFWSLSQTLRSGNVHREVVADLLRDGPWTAATWSCSTGDGPMAQDAFALRLSDDGNASRTRQFDQEAGMARTSLVHVRLETAAQPAAGIDAP